MVFMVNKVLFEYTYCAKAIIRDSLYISSRTEDPMYKLERNINNKAFFVDSDNNANIIKALRLNYHICPYHLYNTYAVRLLVFHVIPYVIIAIIYQIRII